MMSHIYPFATVVNEVRSNTLDGMEIWAGICALSALFSIMLLGSFAWDIVVNGNHPAIQMLKSARRQRSRAKSRSRLSMSWSPWLLISG